MVAKLGSFKYNFQEKRERLLSVQKGYSELGFVHIKEQEPAGSPRCCTFRSVSDRIVGWCPTVQHASSRAVQMGQSDPRK
ncbi:aluminum-activated malate transporter 9-like [Pyrus ussuriensis x Pyrus communis]|uniref:Aluminum-activated malate transporter 9-like n=1 Tax=Pyrus ussuriensis x Pyrus communis TaxID=2448454 RepID=A0A5N5H705_9ROSA|nr:aluminum-activated malate transporter 9-like [Pyrus ussuriensis x Pyrus communis]